MSRKTLLENLRRSQVRALPRILITAFFVLAMLWAMAGFTAGQPPLPGLGERRRGSFPPGPPPREDIDIWESAGGKPLKPGDPLLIWRNALRESTLHARKLERLSREQDTLSERLSGETDAILPGRLTLPAIPRLQERRRIISALHENAQAVEKEEKALRNAANPVVEHAAGIAQRLGDVKQGLDAKIGDSSTEGPRGRPHFMQKQKERIEASIRLMEEVQADPEHGAEKVVDALRTGVLLMDRRGGPGVMIQQIRQQFENLEREQAFLKQRLENHEESLKRLLAQLDFLVGERNLQEKNTATPPRSPENPESTVGPPKDAKLPEPKQAPKKSE